MKATVTFVIVSVIIAITSGKMSVERSSPIQIEEDEEERPIVGGVENNSDHSRVEELLKNNIKQLKDNESELS